MQAAWETYRKQGSEALWDRCCGFLDLSLQQTMQIQHHLLETRLEVLGRSGIGQMVFRGAQPRNADEMRAQVPFTTYADYLSTLHKRQTDGLPEQPRWWVRTSGRSGEYAHKWIPISQQLCNEAAWPELGIHLLAVASRRGDVGLSGNDRYLDLLAPPPFISACMRIVDDLWPFRRFPPPTPEIDALPFQQRTGIALAAAAKEGVDVVVSIASVAAGVGEAFGGPRPKTSLGQKLRNPRALRRMGLAALKSRIAARPLYPRDAWKVRGIATSGMDASLFREQIRRYWGRYPLEFLASTEAGFVATQTWDYTTMTFIPTLNFFEFIPDNELEQEANEAGYRPRTRLLDELEPGRNYELVVTNLWGPLVRYRTGDLIRITSMENERTGVKLPQMAYYSRRGDIIDIGGFTRLTEKRIWEAIEEAGVSYTDWTARKEVWDGSPVLHLRIEPKAYTHLTEDDVQARVHSALRKLDEDWANLEDIAGLRPLRVTFLSPGSFVGYMKRKAAEGAELAHLKPMHMNASDAVVEVLQESAAERVEAG